MLGAPDKIQQNYTGEVETLFGESIFRFFQGRLVECTVPDQGRMIVDGVEVLSMFAWLAEREDAVDMARFRISLSCGIAYDYRHREHGSLSIFEPGRWDALVRPTVMNQEMDKP